MVGMNEALDIITYYGVWRKVAYAMVYGIVLCIYHNTSLTIWQVYGMCVYHAIYFHFIIFYGIIGGRGGGGEATQVRIGAWYCI